MELNNKKMIITGAASGVGLALVKESLSLGATVIGVDISEEALNNLKAEINNPKFDTYRLDVSDRRGIREFRNWYQEKYQTLDILVNNAGIIQPFKKVEELEDDTIDRVMKVNFFGPYDIVQDFLGLMKKESESYIVNVSSMGGFFPFPYQTVYGASKAALKIFTEGLYAELSDTNIKVMIVLPGAMATNISANSGVQVSSSSSTSSYKMLSAEDAAHEIFKGINKNKFKIFVGQDSKFMRILYKLNSKMAINFINKKMKDINK